MQGYDGLRPIFKFKLSPALGEKEIGTLLQRFVCRDLTPLEIVNASLRKRMKGHSSFLNVARERGSRVILSVGSNPHYVASQHTAFEFRDMDEF